MSAPDSPEPRPGDPRSASATAHPAPWIVTIAIVLALTGAWYWLGNGSPAPAPIAPPPAAAEVVSPADRTPARLVGELDAEARAGAASAPAPPQRTTGRLRIRVTDASTGTPVAQATCVVYSERGGEKEHGVVPTDAEGRATLGGLPENTILVHVLRRPPHASGYGGAWLPAGETRDLDLRLDAGGSVFGRVVDDDGRAIADAQVFVPSEAKGSEEAGEIGQALTRTGPEGRFEVTHVVSRPRAVWIVDGQMRPEHWNPVRVSVQTDLARAHASAEVAPGARIDLGDIVISRAARWSGRVLDARRNPVAVALVDVTELHRDPRSLTKWTSIDARLARGGAGIALSGADGSFQIEAADHRELVTVTTREGAWQQFPLPAAERGVTQDLELVLEDYSILELEFVDQQGERVAGPAPVVRQSHIRLPGAARSVRANAGQLEATIVFESGRTVRTQIPAADDGVFRVQTVETPRGPRRLRLELPGYLPIDDRIGEPSGPVERHRYTLHAVPVVRVHIRIAPQPVRGPGERPMLSIQACLLDPAVFASRVPHPGIQCCGQGSIWTHALEGGDHEVELPVLARGSYWLHARVVWSRANEQGAMEPWMAFEKHCGPLASDGAGCELEVPALDLLPLEPTPARTPPEPSTPGSASLVARIVDATTNQGIRHALLVPRPVPERPGGPAWLAVDAQGRTRNARLQPGVWSIRATAKGYRSGAPFDATIRAGETTDLGTIALQPVPEVLLRVLESDGRAVPRGTRLDGWSPSEGRPDTLFQGTTTNDEGSLTLRKDLGAGYVVAIVAPRPGADIDGLRGHQWLSIDFDPAATEHEIRLQPWRGIEVTVIGAIQDHPAGALRVLVGAQDSNPEASFEGGALEELLALPDGTRRFRGDVGGPGRYRLRLRSTLVSCPDALIEVEVRAGIQSFTLLSAR